MAGGDEGDKEPNNFKKALEDALTIINTERIQFWGSPTMTITRAVSSNGGWVCSEGDAWSEECSAQLAGITAAFDDAYADVNTAFGAEPDNVDKDDWRGLSYVNDTTSWSGGSVRGL